MEAVGRLLVADGAQGPAAERPQSRTEVRERASRASVERFAPKASGDAMAREPAESGTRMGGACHHRPGSERLPGRGWGRSLVGDVDDLDLTSVPSTCPNGLEISANRCR